MAGYDPSMAQPTLTQAPAYGSGAPGGSVGTAGAIQPHHGLIGIVITAAAVIVILDYIGFKFAFTAGKR